MRIAELDTPALLLRRDRLMRNITTLSDFFAPCAAALRPHFKTPKCAQVARLQLEAGAIGLTCAKLGEAEALADAGIETSILIANQIMGAAKLSRLIDLAGRVPELCVAVDDVRQIVALQAALQGHSVRIGAVVEVNVGMYRCGTDTPEQTLELVHRLERSVIEYRGLMGYEGHAVLVAEKDKRAALTDAALAELDRHRRALDEAGHPPEIVSAGGTGTFDQTGRHPGITEIQAGSYVFMDGTYRKVRPEFECALTLLTTVLHRRGRLLITDAGMKSLSHEFGMPAGANLPLRSVALSEEHGHVLIDEGADLAIEPGDQIELLPSHGDTTINLHERYQVIEDDRVVESWPIVARGRFQ